MLTTSKVKAFSIRHVMQTFMSDIYTLRLKT